MTTQPLPDPDRDRQPRQQSTESDLGADNAAPATGSELRLKQQVGDALDAVPDGDQLASYFGVGGQPAQQSEEESARSDGLVAELGAISPGDDIGALLQQITQQSEGSDADSDALRALMSGSSKPTTDGESKVK